MAHIIDGKGIAATVRSEVAERVRARTAEGRRPPGLVTILVGDDAASRIYVGSKQRQSKEVGMHSESLELPSTISQDDLLSTIRHFNQRSDIDGILVQMPLPSGLDEQAAIAAIDPSKDVDGLHPLSQGALFTGRPGLRPCTPAGCMRLIDSTGVNPSGLQAVVIGRSVLVGKPVAMMLLERNATVTMCHSRTRGLADVVGGADILIAAVGVAELVKGSWIKAGSVVLDVGMNRRDGKLVGDVEFAAAAERAAFVTPVPGGVGPMTVAMLLVNTLEACVARESAAEQA